MKGVELQGDIICLYVVHFAKENQLLILYHFDLIESVEMERIQKHIHIWSPNFWQVNH